MNTRLITLLLLASTSVMAEDLDPVDKETLVDIYEYCADINDTNVNDEKIMLTCINEELSTLSYQTFTSLSDVKKMIGMTGA
ncbi:hypothetical protein DRW07_13440 [Alteromonas sediminis]|uniref:Uncharacterized protein n=1 Tax=Alteromonas sediminis TaxID=2259342 RepID=A0A3N5YL87_9ALTE|nr:hypothetical protein [Alteromonas sediminis]RPJ65811.1 hypothetical protein DRW07_13440 [Alteromonas sediminis]